MGKKEKSVGDVDFWERKDVRRRRKCVYREVVNGKWRRRRKKLCFATWKALIVPLGDHPPFVHPSFSYNVTST